MAGVVTGRVRVVATEHTGPAMGNIARHVRRMTNEVTTSGRAIERGTNRIHSSLSKLTRFLGQQLTGTVRSFFYGLRMGVVGAGVAVSAFVVTSLKSFRDFDKQLRETTALIAGAGRRGKNGSIVSGVKEAQAAYTDFYKTILRMAPQMRRTPQELTKGLYELVQAGLQGPEAKRLLKPAAMGATAGGSDVGSSARVMVQIMNALRMNTKGRGAGAQGQKVMDQIFQAINLGIGVEFPTMATGIGKFIGAAGTTFKGGRKQGLNSLKQLMATYIFATQQGARTADVGVGIQDVIKTIANPSKKSGAFAKSIGLGGLGSEFLQQHGFVGALTTIIQKMKDAGYHGAKLNDAIGKLFSDVRGRRIVNYATNLGMVNEALKAMGLATGATKRSFDEQGKSLDAAMQTFKSYWETLKIALGSQLAPFVNAGMQRITKTLAGAGVFGRGQDILTNAPAHGRARQKYFAKLSDEDTIAAQQAKRFNESGLGGRVKMIGDSALTSFQAWWASPQVQSRFERIVHSLVQRAFDLLSRTVQTIPSIYKFGRRMAGEILRGVTDGFKDMGKNLIPGMGGGGGGGGLPGGFGISKDPFQATMMALMGIGLAGRGWKKSPLSRGAGVAGGAAMFGLDPITSLLMGVGGVVSGVGSNRRSKRAAAAARAAELTGVATATRSVGQMMVTAGSVVVNGPVTGGGAGGGYMGGGSFGGAQYLKTGYRRVVSPRGGVRYQGPGGRFVSKAEALGTIGTGVAPEAAAAANAVFGGAAPAAAGAAGAAARSGGALSRILSGLKTGGKFAGKWGGKAGGGNMLMNLLMNLPAVMQGNVGGAAGGMALGTAAMFVPGIGPLLSIPASIAGNAIGSWAQDKFFGGAQKPKAPTPAQLTAYQKLMTVHHPLMAPAQPYMVPGTLAYAPGGPGIGGRGAVLNRPAIPPHMMPAPAAAAQGFGGKFGKGGGFDVEAVSKANIGGFSGKFFHSARLFYRLLSKLMAVPFGQGDKAQAIFEQAYVAGSTSDAALSLLQQVAQTWQDKSYEDGQKKFEAAQAKKDRAADRRRRRRAQPALDAETARETRKLPKNRVHRALHKDDVREAARIPATGIFDTVRKDIVKPAKDAATTGTDAFKTQFTANAKALPELMKPAIQTLIDNMWSNSNAMINGVGGSGGPSSNSPAPDSSGATPTDAGSSGGIGGRGGAGRVFQSSAIRGIGEGNAALMGDAGTQLAKKMANHAADAITKKQLEGPMGGAYKALSWLYRQVGKPYIWGGGHPPNANLKGYDCSGLSSTALMVAGSKLAGTTFTMLPQTSPGSGIIKLGFNDPVHPSHMGISVLGKWFEARGHATPILGPGKARTAWPYVGVPKMHTGGVYDSGSVRGEGPAILKDGEMVVRSDGDGGLKAHPVSAGGGFYINGPLIGHAEIRSAHDVHRLANELVDLLEKKRSNSATAGAAR